MAGTSGALTRAIFALAAVGLAAGSTAAGAGAKPSSGPPVGGSTSAFNVHGVTGLGRGSKVCYT